MDLLCPQLIYLFVMLKTIYTERHYWEEAENKCYEENKELKSAEVKHWWGGVEYECGKERSAPMRSR